MSYKSVADIRALRGPAAAGASLVSLRHRDIIGQTRTLVAPGAQCHSGGAGDDPPAGATAAGAPRPGAGRRRDGAGGSARPGGPPAGGGPPGGRGRRGGGVVGAAGVVGASCGDDATAGDEPADLPWAIGFTGALARAGRALRPPGP